MATIEETAPEGAVGQWVAVQRKLAGLTQYQLAARAHVSKSLIGQVERGVTPASPAFTTIIARALKIDVERLYGQPFWSATDAKDEHAGIPALRVALDCDDDPVLDGAPLSAAELRVRLDECDRDRARSRFSQIAARLPELLELSDGTTAVGRAERIQTPERAEPQRAGRHWIDVARAWTLHGDRAKALESLKNARRIAPQLTRYHPQAHETVRILAETDRRATDTLAGFARWIGVTL